MLGLDDYRTRWLAFSERFLDASAEQRSRLAAEVVEGGLPPGEPSSDFDPSAAERGAVEAAVIRAAGLFDAFGYQQHNPDIYWNLCGHQEELEHFVIRGWKELRHPTARLRPVELLVRPPRRHARGHQPPRPLCRRGPARGPLAAPAPRDHASSGAARVRLLTTPGLSLRRLRRRRGH